MDKHIIELNNVSFGYEDDQTVLENYNLQVKQGEWLTILGHNGSGKSTLSKLLVGLLKANDGDIIVDDLVLTEETVYEVRRKIGIVFQNPDNQFVGSTVRDDIAFGLENKQVPYKEMVALVDEYAEKVNMKRFLDREPHRLSGGEKQRVAIAGVLALGANIIILDEATAMLDPRGREDMMSLIQELAQDQDKTIIMITHHLDEAIHSDRIIVMNAGKIMLEGTPDEVFAHKDLLESVQLDVPFAVRASYELKEQGILDQIYTNEGDLVKALCTLNLNQ
ncbi:MAG TPA: energy-coupling factor transporter ATPase [Firmicutes bacterium]|nr:energy-coupling factor transporter ATPase [Bacillota bacterium]